MEIHIRQGESRRLECLVVDEQGEPTDLTYYHAEWRLTPRGSEVPLIIKSTGAGITYLDAAGGHLVIHLNPSDTEIDTGIYRRELRVTSSGNVYTADYGPLVVKDSVFVPK